MTSKPPSIERHLTALPQGPAEAELDLRKLWLSVWLRKWRILITMLVAALVTIWATSWMTPLYRSAATLLVESERAKLLAIEQVDQGEALNRDFLQTEIELLKSRGLAERVVRQLDLVSHPEFMVQQRSSSQGQGTWLDRFSDFFRAMLADNGKEPRAFDRATEKLMGAIEARARWSRSRCFSLIRTLPCRLPMPWPTVTSQASSRLASRRRRRRRCGWIVVSKSYERSCKSRRIASRPIANPRGWSICEASRPLPPQSSR
jgi:hypothetical protein